MPRIRLNTVFTNPALTRYVKSENIARDTFNRAASDLTTIPGSDLEYRTANSEGLTPIAATDGFLAYFRRGVGYGSSFCTVECSPADLFQIGVYQMDTTEHAAIIALQFDSPMRWIAAMRVSAANPVWRIAQRDGATPQTLAQTSIPMSAGDTFRREYVDGAMRVLINGQQVWSGRPLRGANRAGFGLFPGAGRADTRFDLLSVNYNP